MATRPAALDNLAPMEASCVAEPARAESASQEPRADLILNRIEQAHGRPLRALMEISDRCNEVCVHCYQTQGQKGEMTTDEARGVIDELAEMGVLVLTISGGEATLRKDFLDLVTHARARGFVVRLFTNGLTMTEKLARQLAELAVHIVEISLYSPRAEVHDFMTGVAGSFARAVGAVRLLVAAGVDTHLKTPLMSVNEDDVDGYIALARSLGATFALDPNPLMPREGGSNAPRSFDRSLSGLARVLGDPRLANDLGGARAPRAPDAPPCGAGHTVHVEPNGELRPCTILELPLGDARAGVRSARATNEELRGVLALAWRDLHGCRTCDLSGYCRRCHAVSLAEVGDALAPYPTACAEARTLYERVQGRPARLLATPERDTSTGPYREDAPGVFTPVADVITAEDDALAARLGWVRRATLADAQPVPARGGALVQLRRPGRHEPRKERIPGRNTLRPSTANTSRTASHTDAAE